MAQVQIERFVKNERIGWYIANLPIEHRPWHDDDETQYTVILWDWSRFPDVRVAASFENRQHAIKFCRGLGFDKTGAPIAYVGKGSYGRNDPHAVTTGICCDYNPHAIDPGSIKIREYTEADRGLANAASGRTQLKAWDWPGLK